MEVSKKGPEVQSKRTSAHPPIIVLGPIVNWGLNITFASLMSLGVFLLKLLLGYTYIQNATKVLFVNCWVNSHHNLCRTLSLSLKFTKFITDGYLWPAVTYKLDGDPAYFKIEVLFY